MLTYSSGTLFDISKMTSLTRLDVRTNALSGKLVSSSLLTSHLTYRPIPDFSVTAQTPDIPLPILQRIHRSIPLRTSPTNASIMLRHPEPHHSLPIAC